ncbi:MAG: efflux RND transporter periplasmic adaptor subunit [Notoacmeibacter sp.]|nr:efflux RND transporter periplasmic adaptor subunit [Notoacmeibacter sp.]
MRPIAALLLSLGLLGLPLFPAYAVDPSAPDQGLRGVVRSKARLELTTGLTVPVDTVPFRSGSRFSRDDLLVSFDCARLKAELRAAEAVAQAANVELGQKAQLRKYGAAGKGEVDLAAAGAARSAAELELAAVRMSDCEIRAPFDGRVVETGVDAHEMPQPGKPLMIIVDDSNLEIDLVAPSNWLGWLRNGAGFAFTLDETGQTRQAIVTAIGAEVDAVSQTIRLTGEFAGHDTAILPGMSGTADFSATAPTASIRKAGEDQRQ